MSLRRSAPHQAPHWAPITTARRCALPYENDPAPPTSNKSAAGAAARGAKRRIHTDFPGTHKSPLDRRQTRVANHGSDQSIAVWPITRGPWIVFNRGPRAPYGVHETPLSWLTRTRHWEIFSSKRAHTRSHNAERWFANRSHASTLHNREKRVADPEDVACGPGLT